MADPFPRWWRYLAAAIVAGYVVFAIAMTVVSWPALSGSVSSTGAVWLVIWWALGLGGGAVAVVAVLVFSHAMWQMATMSGLTPPPRPRCVPMSTVVANEPGSARHNGF